MSYSFHIFVAVKKYSTALDEIMDAAVLAGADTTGETSAKKLAIESVLLDYQDALYDYMVTDQDLQDLYQKILDYSIALESRGGAKSSTVAQNQRLTLLFKSTDDLLERKIDRIAFRLKHTYPKFYDAYCHARQIIDL